MSEKKIWHEDDQFWEEIEEWIFMEGRWRAAAEEVGHVIKLLEVEDGAAILDFACGPGRHSIDLARRGYRVTGIDRTVRYLERARNNADREGLQIEYIQEDMRRFTRDNGFDAVISMYTAIGYFEPDEEKLILSNMYRCLKPNGRLVVDLIGKEVIARLFRSTDWIEKDGAFFLEERIPDDDWTYINNRWIIIKDGRVSERKIRLRLYSAYELTSLLKEVGFRETKCYGHLDGSPYDHKAVRLAVMATK